MSDPGRDALFAKWSDTFDDGDDYVCVERAGFDLLVAEIESAVCRAAPAITERELTFALNYHGDDARIKEADWKIARRYFDIVECNRGLHPSLGGPDPFAPTEAPAPVIPPEAWRWPRSIYGGGPLIDEIDGSPAAEPVARATSAASKGKKP